MLHKRSHYSTALQSLLTRTCNSSFLQQQLVTREHRKETKRRRRTGPAEEAPDVSLGDVVEDGAGLPKAFLHSYCCLDYARLIEVAQLRLALLRKRLKEQVQDKYAQYDIHALWTNRGWCEGTCTWFLRLCCDAHLSEIIW